MTMFLALSAFLLASGCKPKCVVGAGSCTEEWQKETKRICKATLKLSNADLSVVMSLRVVASEEMFSTPPSQWNPIIIKDYNSSGSPEIACRSNLFIDQKVQKSRIEELSDQICSITLSDDQQTRYDLSWHTDETVGKTTKEAVGFATVKSKSLPEAKITLTSAGRDIFYSGRGTGMLYQSEAKILHFTEIPIAVEYKQTLNDGVDTNNTSNDGKRYAISCKATNIISTSIPIPNASNRDPTLFQQTCRFSVFNQNTVAVHPTTDGIKAQLLSAQDVVLQEVSSQDCQ